MVQVRRDYVSTHSRLKAAGYQKISNTLIYNVSTHSRLKAAGSTLASVALIAFSFNTQPPEGGWASRQIWRHRADCFNTQPPEGGWTLSIFFVSIIRVFQHTAA